MSQEIERKFLVTRTPALDGTQAEAVRQGYISATDDATEVRLRQKGEGYFLTVKCGSALVRSEHEIAITEPQFTALWSATEGRRLEKTRHTGALADRVVFELDIYEGALAPLMVVEVEFASVEAAEAFTPPDWFGQDVTADKRFKNKALAVASAPPVA